MEKITKEQCLEFFNIFPQGNPRDVHEKIERAITFRRTYKDNSRVTLDLLIEKYKKYINFCKSEGREAKYIKTPAKWIEAHGWDEEIIDVESYIDKLKNL